MLRILTLALAALTGILAIVLAARWLFDPAGAAEAAGMPLLNGVARSTQVGDLGALMFVSGSFTLLGVLRRQPGLLYTPLSLLAAAAVFRALAAVFSGAALAHELIGVEIVLCAIIFAAQRQLIRGKAKDFRKPS